MERVVRWLFEDRTTGRLVVAQWPNAALWVFVAASVARRTADPEGTAGTVVAAIATVALVVWALDEIVRGVNPFRRILGAAVLAGVIAGAALG